MAEEGGDGRRRLQIGGSGKGYSWGGAAIQEQEGTVAT